MLYFIILVGKDVIYMMAISSSDLLNEFTIYADKVVDEKETLIVQRSSGKNIVIMSMEQFNELQKETFFGKECSSKKSEVFAKWK